MHCAAVVEWRFLWGNTYVWLKASHELFPFTGHSPLGVTTPSTTY